jgi:SAM-dependent methyltransferase
MSGRESHGEVVRRAFTAQAEAFEDPARNQVFNAGAVDWLLEALARGPSDLALDVASGTGHIARALAPDVAAVVALDTTAAMLAAGRGSAEAEGLQNIVFQLGEATALPFLDASFDVITCRFAVHHFADPARVASEIARCLRPGGRALVIDGLADADPAVASTQNGLERMRDPSHTRMLSERELLALLADAGLDARTLPARDFPRPLAPWLEQTALAAAARARIEAELDAEIAGGPASGLRAQRREGERWFVHRFGGVLGVRR